MIDKPNFAEMSAMDFGRWAAKLEQAGLTGKEVMESLTDEDRKVVRDNLELFYSDADALVKKNELLVRLILTFAIRSPVLFVLGGQDLARCVAMAWLAINAEPMEPPALDEPVKT